MAPPKAAAKVRGSAGKRSVTSGADTASPATAPLPPARVEPDLVEVPRRTVLALEGRGAPGDATFQRSVGALYGIAYGVKFARRANGKSDFAIGPLEARWWNDTPERAFLETAPTTWRWCLRLGVPDDLDVAELGRAVTAAVTSSKGKLHGSSEAQRIAVADLPAERFARALHVGPYADEKRTFDRIAAFLAERGLGVAPRHIEIYLSDPTCTPPARLHTVILVELG